MARRPSHLPDGTRVVDAIGIGVLSKTYPLASVKEVLGATKKESVRTRSLPAHVMIYYVMALALCSRSATQEVLRWLLQGIEWLLYPVQYGAASKSGITQARQRLGVEPLRRLYQERVKPIAVPQTRGAWYRKWRLTALDGSTAAVADTPENEREWGRATNQRSEAGYPTLRFVSLLETGTHVLFATELGSYHDSEVTLAETVVKQLRAGMLCLADRQFLGYRLWEGARQTGADLLWRAKKTPYLPCWQRLQDGSYLSYLYSSPRDRKRGRNGVLVRVIEYRLEGIADSEASYRLVTTILDPDEAPAQELAALYHERWEIEIALGECKTHLRGERVVLRSKTPELVRQEFYGYLLTHFAIRGLMHEAALEAGLDSDQLSFLHAVRVIRRKVQQFVISPQRRTCRTASAVVTRNPGRTGGKQSRTPCAAGREAEGFQVPGSSTQAVPGGQVRLCRRHSNP